MHVKVKRVESENLSVVLPSLLEFELHTADVVLLVDNQILLYAHKCFLSTSPVLKEMLMSLEVRLEELPYISMPGFNKESVFSFLHFLYKGFVVFENTDIHQEFLKLCTILKVNPPVVQETIELHSDAGKQCVVLPTQALNDPFDDVIYEEQDFEEVQDPEPAPKLQLDSISLFRETPFVENSNIAGSYVVPSVESYNMERDKFAPESGSCPMVVIPMVVMDELSDVHESSHKLETSPSPKAGKELGSMTMCNGLCPHSNNNMQTGEQLLENLKSSSKDENGNETAESGVLADTADQDEKNVSVPTWKPRESPAGKKVENRGAHLRVPDHLKVAKKEYVPTGRPRVRLPGSKKVDRLKKKKRNGRLVKERISMMRKLLCV